MNRLVKEKSAYLQHAAHQKINWYPWSEEAFEKARQEDKPVFLSSGAVWCHWCHVMAKESFENDEVAAILDKYFIAVKLDRDERPDIDRRYQQVLSAMGFGGGWPLSMFLTPDKKPFYGGTYFPPDDRYGRPGFKSILMTIAELYKTRKGEIEDQSRKLLDILKPEFLQSRGTFEEPLIEKGLARVMGSIDALHGGFGQAPKFPMPGGIEFLLNRYFFTKDEAVGRVLKKTLTSMANGGFHDQLGGGFHRYSTDQAWIVPHFEKMADDNSWLLRNYVDGYAILGDPYFREVAEDIIAFIRRELSHPDGGFYASQDADVTPDDEGGYFTWTDEELRSILTDQEYKVLSHYFLHDRGMMHHDPLKRVLYVSATLEELAAKLGMDLPAVTSIVRRGKERLLRAREARTRPFIDRAFYTSLNGMLASAFFKTYKVLGHTDARQFALKSLDKVLAINMVGDDLFHSEGVKGMFDDHVHLIDALIGAYEVTGDLTYLDQADHLMGRTIEKFWDRTEGAFFDTDEEVLGMRLKTIEEMPHPSANSLAILLLLKLSFMRDNDVYRVLAEKSLNLFAGPGEAIGVHGAYYFCGLHMYFHGLELTAWSSPDSELTKRVFSIGRPYTTIIYRQEQGYITPCSRNVCYEPLYRPEDIERFLLQGPV
ncbi:thioredoxin domain-containing protein [Syntrophorhabdus aromaticivorans]|uniref:thioredoxin domain-containing protein n=1 Tax=Syntrophorhabdus aromaticivorans TaxID=328301 RepID=UPI000425C51C|nr:thioredoxin domain-containing protein [Syntrophorhabdus aromaticivorans]